MSVEVRAATGRFDDLAQVIGPRTRGVEACWCVTYRDSRVPAAKRREFMRGACSADPGPGVLVYVDDEVAGWCSIAPRASYRRLMNSRTLPHADDDPGVWVAICFVIRPGFRRRGLLHDLLAGAVAHAGAHGATAIEGYPVDVSGGTVDAVAGYVGTVAVFERAGFTRAGATSSKSGGRTRWVMRRDLPA